MNEDKAARYHRLRRRVGMGAPVMTGSLLVAILVSGGSAALRDAAAAVAGAAWAADPLQTWLVVAVYVSVLFLAREALTLPLSFYGGFVLERRYGLSVQRAGEWLRDHGKAVLLG